MEASGFYLFNYVESDVDRRDIKRDLDLLHCEEKISVNIDDFSWELALFYSCL